MADFQVFLVINVLTWAAVSVSGTSEELSSTTGDTANIPCLFGEGTVHNIFWYYRSCTGGHKILFFVKEEFTFGAEYANRTSLQKDNATLILKDITVADEGTYCCTVDRQWQTAVPDINTKLNVFSLRPDTLPVVSPCIGSGESSSCSIHADQSFTLTCTLSNVYPVEDTELIWYQDGKRVSSTDNVTQNDDGTTNISRQIQVLETGNFTCNATYLSAYGRGNTAVSVKACVISPADVPNTLDKNLMIGLITGITTCIMLLVGILICCLKTRGLCCFRKDKKKRDETQLNPVASTEVSKLLGTSAEDGSKDGNEPTEGTAENRSTNEAVEISTLVQSPTLTQGGNVNRSNQRIISDEEILKLSMKISCENYTALCVALGYEITFSNNIATKCQLNYSTACQNILNKWKQKTGGLIQDLDEALVAADIGGLRSQYKIETNSLSI